MWLFGRGARDDDESSYESYSSYEEYTDDEVEEEEQQQGKVVIDTNGVVNESTEEPTRENQQRDEKEAAVKEDTTKDASVVPSEDIVESAMAEDQPAEVEETVDESSSEEEEDSDDEVVVVQPDQEEHDDQSMEHDAGMSYSSEESLDTNEDDDQSAEDSQEEEEEFEDEEDDDEEEEDDEDDEEEPSSLCEKHSLLALAAEHDRVDILKAILAENAQEQSTLLNAPIPPLHVAVCYGSTHATSCLLRMGANPAIRPNVAEIQKSGEKHLIEMANLARYDDVSAWELAFGRAALEENEAKPADKSSKETKEMDQKEATETKKSWFGVFGRSSSSKSVDDDKADVAETEEEAPATNPQSTSFRRRNVQPAEMAPSKREGIRHAFMAEALRCIGADEVQRLQQLLDSGMPSAIDAGGKTLHGWCVEMGAPRCEELIRPPEKPQDDEKDGDVEEQQSQDEDAKEQTNPFTASVTTEPGPTVAHVNGDKESLASLFNRLEELESLATALSSCLDNLAEEVSVCHGLLLSGGGAAALASHVRSLKNLRAQRQDELEHWTREWHKSDSELAHWVREYGGTKKYKEDFPATTLTNVSTSRRNKLPEPQSAEEEESQRRQLLAQLAASENKVRKLRASITDLSEENTRDLEEVERRSLTGGVKLVRSLRDELREVEFKLSEAKSGEAACRAHVNMIQSRLETSAKKKPRSTPSKTEMKQNVAANGTGNVDRQEEDASRSTESTALPADTGIQPPSKALTEASDSIDQEPPTLEENTDGTSQKRPSQLIATGDSTALTVHQPHARGYLPVDLWDIILRIIGMGKEAVKRSAKNMKGSTSNVMIV